MVQWALSTGLISLAAFALLLASTPLTPQQQPIQFSHKRHLDYFRDGRHRQSMVAMHEKLLLEELGDEQVVAEMVRSIEQGSCQLCHGDFDENVKNVSRLRHCGECHRVFLEHDLEERQDQRPCMGCHRAAVQYPWASVPNIHTCAACHPTPLPGAPLGLEETKLVEFIEQEKTIPWARVYDYLPGDIVFSHERHVELGRVKCQECHGHVEQAERPLSLAVTLSMEDCMGCHEAAGADNDCLACHK